MQRLDDHLNKATHVSPPLEIIDQLKTGFEHDPSKDKLSVADIATFRTWFETAISATVSSTTILAVSSHDGILLVILCKTASYELLNS